MGAGIGPLPLDVSLVPEAEPSWAGPEPAPRRGTAGGTSRPQRPRTVRNEAGHGTARTS